MERRKPGRYLASVKVGPKGQIVIPKEAREMFGIEPGDTLLLMADKKRGIALHEYEVASRMFPASLLPQTIEELETEQAKEQPDEKGANP